MSLVRRFYGRLRNAADERQVTHISGVVFIVAGAAGGTVAYIALALLLIPADVSFDYNFYEGGPVTALSAVFLTSAGAFSLASFVAILGLSDRYEWVWLLLAVGFAFLALDELMEFHERVGRLLSRYESSGMFRSWDDIIVILYGVIALPIFLAILPKLLRYRLVLEMFVIAFVFYALHTYVDSTSEPPTSSSVVVEESAKLLCGSFLAIGAFIGFVGVLWKKRVE